MAKLILIDEFHLTVRVPAESPEARIILARRTLNGRRFQARLRKAVRTVIHQHPSLRFVRVNVAA
jgi:hypothetical protein